MIKLQILNQENANIELGIDHKEYAHTTKLTKKILSRYQKILFNRSPYIFNFNPTCVIISFYFTPIISHIF